jgi:hypothetical protein
VRIWQIREDVVVVTSESLGRRAFDADIHLGKARTRQTWAHHASSSIKELPESGRGQEPATASATVIPSAMTLAGRAGAQWTARAWAMERGAWSTGASGHRVTDETFSRSFHTVAREAGNDKAMCKTSGLRLAAPGSACWVHVDPMDARAFAGHRLFWVAPNPGWTEMPKDGKFCGATSNAAPGFHCGGQVPR